jgi:hypothetical protein
MSSGQKTCPGCVLKPRNTLATTPGEPGVRIARVRDDPYHSVLHQWAGRPTIERFGAEPVMGRVVAYVGGVDQSDQHVQIEQERHADSSRNALTTASVTRAVSRLTGNSGMPFLREEDTGRVPRSPHQLNGSGPEPAPWLPRERRHRLKALSASAPPAKAHQTSHIRCEGASREGDAVSSAGRRRACGAWRCSAPARYSHG